MTDCMKKSVESPKLTFSPYPVKIKPGAIHKVAFEFDLVKEIPMDADVDLKMFVGDIALPGYTIGVINPSILFVYKYVIISVQI